ncbi:MAG: hypothetical protein NDI77_02770 [Geobacteraceae bacterium]|nr:hypothetical protein [Geobacteraceae bacterium]
MIDTDKENMAKLVACFRSAIIKSYPATLPLITLQNFPFGACGDAALLLAKYLQENEYGDFDYVLGEREGCSHAWLQQESLIIDITADQFEDQKATVIVTEDHSWHSLFNGEIQNIADFEIYDPYTVSELRRAYNAIMREIEI